MDRLHQWAAGAMGAMIVCLVAALALTRWKAWLLFGLAVLFLAGGSRPPGGVSLRSTQTRLR
jgi:hypothetical protein